MQKNISQRELLYVHQTGLIRNRSHQHIHASPNYVGLTRIDDEVQPIFVEIKYRTRLNTALTEERLISPINEREISASTDDANTFGTNVLRKNERMQLLHQATSTSFEVGLFVIGNHEGDIIRKNLDTFPYKIG